jgi:membrane protein implicated in regulation of membrane protease activity
MMTESIYWIVSATISIALIFVLLKYRKRYADITTDNNQPPEIVQEGKHTTVEEKAPKTRLNLRLHRQRWASTKGYSQKGRINLK